MPESATATIPPFGQSFLLRGNEFAPYQLSSVSGMKSRD